MGGEGVSIDVLEEDALFTQLGPCTWSGRCLQCTGISWFDLLYSLQANNTLRAVGHLTRNELRYLVRANDNEGLPYPIMEHLKSKVHQFVNVSGAVVGWHVSETECLCVAERECLLHALVDTFHNRCLSVHS